MKPPINGGDDDGGSGGGGGSSGESCAAIYEVLLARLDARYGDPARSFTLVQHIASFLGPRPNHVTQEAIAKYKNL